jgi:hypothetical protein
MAERNRHFWVAHFCAQLAVAYAKMLLEGLQPVPRQVVVDVVTLMGMLQSTWMMAQAVSKNAAAQLQRSALVLMMTGLWIILSPDIRFTNRWTLIVTWIGVTILHLFHRFLSQRRISRYHYDSLHWLLTILCALFIASGAALCTLFPALELPLADGPLEVGAAGRLTFHSLGLHNRSMIN